ncbi:TetR/AcrR family transcriptional regulator [Propionicimonas sp.]|uniref:TetR/AcrR family transcriptional regulator n=1 Tax=Propionicimonas sp. TaxID=1955623 RepID=UPI0039E4DAFB
MVKRSYDASRRRAAAQGTRQAILDAAAKLFVDPGYAGARLSDVAEVAGVAVPTIAAHFGSKKGLLSAVLDVSIAGDDEPIPMAARSFVDDINALPTARGRLERYAVELARTLPRVVDVRLALEHAATVDADAAVILAKNDDEQLRAMTMFAAGLMATGEVRLELDHVVSVLVLAMAARNYDWLVKQRGFGSDDFVNWYVGSVAGAILAEP